MTTFSVKIKYLVDGAEEHQEYDIPRHDLVFIKRILVAFEDNRESGA